MVSIHAVDFGTGAGRKPRAALTAAQRRRVLALADRVRLGPRTTVYHEGDPLTDIFIVGDGLVKSYRELASGRRRIVAFLFARDLFGLSEHGAYVNTTRTITETTLYRIPYEKLAGALLRDAEMQSRFLGKITEKLRQSQRQTIVLGRRDAIGRLAMFLKMLEEMPHPVASRKSRDVPIALQMSRTDIAEFLGLSLEAVSRAARELASRKIVTFAGAHAAVVKDRAGFESLVDAA